MMFVAWILWRTSLFARWNRATTHHQATMSNPDHAIKRELHIHTPAEAPRQG